VPPVVALVSVVVPNIGTELAPAIAAGDDLTVNALVFVHPELIAYVIVTVPDDTPLIIPLEASAVARALLLLLHKPPG
jgi:hypothetical protein